MNRHPFRRLMFAAIRMAHLYPWKPAGIGALIGLLGAAVAALGWLQKGLIVAGTGLAVTAAVTSWWWLRHVARPWSTARLIARRAMLDQRSGGVATWLDVAETAGAQALRLQAAILRPSLAAKSWWTRRFVDTHQLGVEILRVGWRGLPGHRIYSSCEDATLRIGGPRTGKTLSLACHGLDAPGALITTSTRLDIAEMVHQARSRRGLVHVFNPVGLGGLQPVGEVCRAAHHPHAEDRVVELQRVGADDRHRLPFRAWGLDQRLDRS